MDILLAFKALGLARELKDCDRRVGCALLDHYNQKTTQCDPSLGTLAVLVGMSRRSVIRSVNRLVKLGFFHRLRHGGHFHRNSYEPAWDRLRAAETHWRDLRKMHSKRFGAEKLASSQCQIVCSTSDAAVTQTNTTNLSNETNSGGAVATNKRANAIVAGSKGAIEHGNNQRPYHNRSRYLTPSLTAAAGEAAKRRWTNALNSEFRDTPDVHARVLDAIDPELQSEITLIERDRPGRGIFVLLERLCAKGAI